jgi:hypothetical protein
MAPVPARTPGAHPRGRLPAAGREGRIRRPGSRAERSRIAVPVPSAPPDRSPAMPQAIESDIQALRDACEGP